MGRKTTSIIPKAPVGRIILNAGARRVSADAIDEFTAMLTEQATKIAQRAVEIARHAGRKTVHDTDIKLAASKE